MSEFDKLTQKWQQEHTRRFTKHLGQYYAAVGKLQAECKHTKTHWMQELDKEGNYKEGLFKRCFICGATVEKLDAKSEAIEVAMKAFDDAVEANKSLTNVPEEQTKQSTETLNELRPSVDGESTLNIPWTSTSQERSDHSELGKTASFVPDSTSKGEHK